MNLYEQITLTFREEYGRYNKTEIEQNMVPNRLDFTFTPKWMWIFMVNEYRQTPAYYLLILETPLITFTHILM